PRPVDLLLGEPVADRRVDLRRQHAMVVRIGDRLSEKQIDWAWYSGAWQYALEHRDTGTVPDFQYHHQPFNYFANYAPGTEARRR
ncbi:alkaline phosphatase family protein, partial [Burkholderia multivorans]|uniref:alkaline phosphatase family protein n=1 Tax=Burkholderia multivorans TaxID=87883 RepID=UPI00283A9F55